MAQDSGHHPWILLFNYIQIFLFMKSHYFRKCYYCCFSSYILVHYRILYLHRYPTISPHDPFIPNSGVVTPKIPSGLTPMCLISFLFKNMHNCVVFFISSVQITCPEQWLSLRFLRSAEVGSLESGKI